MKLIQLIVKREELLSKHNEIFNRILEEDDLIKKALLEKELRSLQKEISNLNNLDIYIAEKI